MYYAAVIVHSYILRLTSVRVFSCQAELVEVKGKIIKNFAMDKNFSIQFAHVSQITRSDIGGIIF
ncbi:MAG: hypothetical protein Wins2KO_06230 [Winogradskyella sp.]